MSRFPSLAAALAAALALSAPAALAEGDAKNGSRVFKKCAACHTVGATAKNRIGPHLNDILGRAAASVDGFRYSKVMRTAGDDGLVWTAAELDAFLAKPKTYLKGTKMAFAGLRKQADRDDLIAYLRDPDGASAPATAASSRPKQVAAATPATETPRPTHGVFHLGRPATAAEIAAWDIDIRPDGLGLPDGSGTVAEGEVVFTEKCASCHGDFGEGIDRWPVLAGGFDTLTAERPVKTIGSYWPYLSTVFDYVRRAMPFGDARSISDDEVYALTAYLLYLNDIVMDEDFALSKQNFTSMRLANEKNFVADDRAAETHYADKDEPCMRDCKPAPAKVLMRARVLDVTPENDDNNGGVGAVD